MMSVDDVLIVTLWIAVFLGLWVIKLKFNLYRMRKKLRAHEAAVSKPALESAPVAPVVAPPARDEEIFRLKSRIAVLERIAVEKENSLAREIDLLRDR